MITVKSREEIQKLRKGGKILSSVLKQLAKACRPGVSAKELDILAEKLMRKAGATPAFLGYRPNAAARPFPASICVSVNAIVVHGIPLHEIILNEGDLVTIDLGVAFQKLFTDAAVTVGIGKVDRKARELMRVTKGALEEAMKYAKPGNALGDIGYSIQEYVAGRGFSIVQGLGGHGVGYSLHEDPFVANVGIRGSGPRLKEGMVLAIEPMVTTGSGEILMRQDGSFVTKDGAPAAHFEHTVAITKKRQIVLTKS
ncbi:MAG: type I methionyl aminopeptidase [Parcubacteria group bacterium]|nr:type I methionyl aminopeptidase [Parcubacteria group bacterium]